MCFFLLNASIAYLRRSHTSGQLNHSRGWGKVVDRSPCKSKARLILVESSEKNADLSNSDPPCCASCGNIVLEEEAMGFKNKPASHIRLKPFSTLCAGKGYNRVVVIYWVKPIYPRLQTYFSASSLVKSCFLEFVYKAFVFQYQLTQTAQTAPGSIWCRSLPFFYCLAVWQKSRF